MKIGNLYDMEMEETRNQKIKRRILKPGGERMNITILYWMRNMNEAIRINNQDGIYSLLKVIKWGKY